MVINPRCEIWQYFDNIVEEGVAVCKLCKQRLKNERSYSLRKHINKLHNPKSEIWKHFDNVVDECVAVCKICSKRVRNNRHFNLILHLKQHEIFVEVPDDEGDTNKTKKPTVLNQSIGLGKPERFKGNLYIDMEESTLVGAVLGLVIDEGVEPRIFSSRNMQDLLNPMCEALTRQEQTKYKIDEYQTERVISLVANHMSNEFINELHWRLLSLRIDLDSNGNSKSYCLSVQFIVEGVMEIRRLGVINLNKGQTLVGQQIMDILHKFNIDSNQIVSASWDDTKEHNNRSISNSDYQKEIEKYEEIHEIHVGDLKIERYIGVIAHHCILDLLKNATIFELFLQCRSLTNFINDNLEIFKEQFEKKFFKIPQPDSPWICGSTVLMMNDLRTSFALIKTIIHDMTPQPDLYLKLDDNLKNFIDAFCKSLSFIQKSILKFNNEELNFGDFYAQWLKCKLVNERLLKAKKNPGSYMSLILTELQKSIERRSNELLNQDLFKACLYLDPRFQHLLNFPEKMFALEYLRQLWDRSKLYNAVLVDPVTESRLINLPTRQVISLNDEDEDACLNEYLCEGVQDSETSGIYRKLEELKLPFQLAETNILEFWKEMKFKEPQIYTLSTVCFAIPATQNNNKINYMNPNSSMENANMPSYLKANLTLIRINQRISDSAIESLGLFREDDSSDNDENSSDDNNNDNDDNSSELKSLTDDNMSTINIIPTTSSSNSLGDNEMTINIIPGTSTSKPIGVLDIPSNYEVIIKSEIDIDLDE